MFYSGLSWHNFHVAPTCKSSLRDSIYIYSTKKKFCLYTFSPQQPQNHTFSPHLNINSSFSGFFSHQHGLGSRPETGCLRPRRATRRASPGRARSRSQATQVARDPGRRRPRPRDPRPARPRSQATCFCVFLFF